VHVIVPEEDISNIYFDSRLKSTLTHMLTSSFLSVKS